ncbi:MAG: type II toxin-antitoxin system prevent-host-death family antitoxin [Sciscionella sp.]|nr:type II toxin-antitoxin system prevent-host-death family antitoxin [Sciscionella sp.]
MTASEASRAFSSVLDDAEAGETIVVTRGGRRVATIAPASAGTWGALRTALAGWKPIDDPDLDADVAAAREAIELDEDPWRHTG